MIPRVRSFTDFDRPYRRGVVLGLSLAELFLILLFLLLLATIGYAAIVQTEFTELRSSKDQVSREKARAEARAVAAEKERKALADELAQVKKALGNIVEGQNPLDLIVGLQKRIAELEARIDQLTPAAKLGNKVHDAAREAGVNPSEVPKTIGEVAKLRKSTKELQSQLADAKQKIVELQRQYALLAEEKGQYPPCWYEQVPRPVGKPRERALYIFHVKISDDSIFVKDIPAPTREYALQKPTLPFDRRAVDRSMSFEEFVTSFKPLRDAGHNGKVQAYSCKFFVAVWDATTSKDKYKHALEKVVETMFFTYLVEGQPWPY